MVKRVDEKKRQLLYLLYTIYRYNQLKKMSPQERVKQVPRYHFIGGKTAIGNQTAKQIVKLFNQVANTINVDPETSKYLRIIFVPNYNASKEHLVVPAMDFNEQISLPGEEACTTISEKFILNGALIIGSHDATNITIKKHLGEHNVTIFGMTYQEVKKFKKSNTKEKFAAVLCEDFKETVKKVIEKQEFGPVHQCIKDILSNALLGIDPYLIGIDF